MSEHADSARKSARAKMGRMLKADPHAKVDASSWTPPEMLNANVQTGQRPISRRAFKRGGMVVDGAAVRRGDRKPRARRDGGGGVPTTRLDMAPTSGSSFMSKVAGSGGGGAPAPDSSAFSTASNRWNPSTGPGKKRGGKVHSDAAADKKLIKAEIAKHEKGCSCAKCMGGRANRASGGGNWIAGAIKHPGALHRSLGVPQGKKIPAEVVLYSAGREGATHDLALFAAGLEAEDRGRIRVGPSYQTDVDHIYAVGDVIGFPSLAATSSEQGRLAACCAFDEGCRTMGDLLPIGIYTIPEISFVGKTEEELTSAAIPYEIGVARYRELARGHIVGDTTGVLKLLVSAVDRTILGVHVFGQSATELVHVGQAVMSLGGTVDYLVDAVFNYPTLSEAYKVAALDATNKLRTLARVSG